MVNIVKNNLAKQSARDAFDTFDTFGKTTGDLIGNEIANKIKTHPQVN